MAAAVVAGGGAPPLAGEAAPVQQPQEEGLGLVDGTLSSPRLPRQLSIRSKLLYSAIQEDDYETVVRLVEAKIREHEENYLGQQEHRFAEEPPAQDMPFLILATLKGNVRVMKFLLEKEVESVNVCDAHHGNTPLHYAVMMGGKGHTGRDAGPLAAKQHGAGRKRARACWAPLPLRRGHARRPSQVEERAFEACAKDLIGFLLAHGADPLVANHKGITPLMEMARYYVPPPQRPPSSPLLRLLPFGYYSPAPTMTSASPQDLDHPVLVRMRQLLLTHSGVRGEVDARDAFGRTALFIAADTINAEAVRILLQVGGADPTIPNARGVAPYDLLKGRGRAHFRILPTYWPVLRLLEDALAEPDRRLLLLKARALGDEGYAIAHAAATAMAKGATEAEGLQDTHDAAPAFLQQRLPAPVPAPAIPFSDDSSQRPLPALPSVAVRWDRLAALQAEAGADTDEAAEVEAKLLETRLGVLQHVVHGGLLRSEHFQEVLELMRVKWDCAPAEEQA